MAETLESFVAKLQAEGVQAGRQSAEQIRAQAQAQAGEILSQARREAQAILEAAQAQAKGDLARARTELQLAARDALLRLRDGLNKALRAVLERGAKTALSDKEFLGKLIHEVVVAYAQADAQGQGTLEVHVAPETRRKLVDWALKELAARTGSSVDLKDTLRQEGFEVHLAGTTVEVTLESITDTLAELVGPDLRALLEAASAQGKP